MKINFSTKILTHEVLSVSSVEVATRYIHMERLENPCIDEVLTLLKEVRRLCKDNGIKVKRAGYKKLLEGFKSDHSYKEMVSRYDANWENLKEGWQQLIINGLYAPTLENEELERIDSVYREMQRMLYRSTELSQVNNIYRTLIEYKRNIEYEPERFYSISL